MILHPLRPAPPGSSETIPAWKAVAAAQKQSAPSWWLVAQPDHAALAGDLAAQFAAPGFQISDREVLGAIALHDAGWAKYDGGGQASGGQNTAPRLLRDTSGRPLSFLQAPVEMFVEAWTASIAYAEVKAGATGGLMVSGHFRRLAEHRLNSVEDTPDDVARIRAFVSHETHQDETRFRRQPRTHAELERLVDVLQFCDLLSLYLCCGSRASVQFPQALGPRPMVLRRSGELCRLEPSPFCKEISLGVAARRDPLSRTEPNTCILPVLIR
ncbi:MAG TPA: DUF3891 family protein [Terriglobales bacterium]|nr:DUF3891 family protein [Terriglobales bacterium]